MSSVIIIPHDEQDGTGDEALTALAFDCGDVGKETLSCLLLTDTFFPGCTIDVLIFTGTAHIYCNTLIANIPLTKVTAWLRR